MVAKYLAVFALFCAAFAAPDTRIVGGVPTTIEQFPYISAYIYHYPGPDILVQRCVGSIISSWHILTTAFCFTGAVIENMHVRVGSTNSMSGGQVAYISNVIKHPEYLETPRSHDIAISFVQTPLPMSSTVGILFIPPPLTYIPDYTETKVVSWGFETEGGPQLETLKTVNLNKLPLDVCADIYKDNDNVSIVDATLCAASEGRGICAGDSGAPMVIGEVLIGLSSYFDDCEKNDLPDVFTRIDRHTNWILDNAVAPNRNGIPVRVAPVH